MRKFVNRMGKAAAFLSDKVLLLMYNDLNSLFLGGKANGFCHSERTV